MTSRRPNSTKTRRASTGKKQVPTGRARKTSKPKRPELAPDDDDGWLSIDDLCQPEDADDWQRNGQTEHEAAVDYYFHRYTRPAPEREPTAGTIYRAAYEALILKYDDYDSVPCEEWSKIIHTGDGSKIDPAGAVYEAAYKALILKYGDYDSVPWEEWRKIDPDKEREQQQKKEERMNGKNNGGNNNNNGADDDDGPDHGDFDKIDMEEDGDDTATRVKKRLKARANKELPLHIKVANVFIEAMKTGVRLQRFNDAEGRSLHMWKYENGLWSWLPDRSVAKWLTPQLQYIMNVWGCEKHSSVKQLNEAVQHVIRHERVCVDKDYCFDQHGKVPTRDGLIDPITHQIEPLKPGHFATWVLPKVKYDPAAKCPNWLQMLDDALSDKTKEDRELDIQLIQEWMGMSLLDDKPKALQRALILLGLGDTGKTSLQQVMAGMLSSTWITTPLSALSGTHGTQAFIKRAPWVLGEAFTTSVWHLADTVKMILGGDSIEINPKNQAAICIKPYAPAIWATNYSPKFREPTRAIVERIVMLELTKVFDKAKPIGIAAAARKVNPAWWPHDLILNTERAGVLNWMLEGAKRVLGPDRGSYINTKAGEALLEGILDDSNVARAFNKDCTELDPNSMVSAPDYMASLVQWWQEHHGDDVRPPNATMIGVHLKALGDPRILQDKDKFKDEDGKRFYLGVKLNQAGLDHWLTASLDERQSGRKSATRTSSSPAAVTQQIKPQWLKLPEVVTMQKAHKKDGTKTST